MNFKTVKKGHLKKIREIFFIPRILWWQQFFKNVALTFRSGLLYAWGFLLHFSRGILDLVYWLKCQMMDCQKLFATEYFSGFLNLLHAYLNKSCVITDLEFSWQILIGHFQGHFGANFTLVELECVLNGFNMDPKWINGP